MKAEIGAFFKRRLFKSSKAVAWEIDEELSFHLQLLTQAYLQQDLPAKEAQDAAVRRFGNVERIKSQCLVISRRSGPGLKALKSFQVLMFLSGVVVRVLSPDISGRHLGVLLIIVPILSRLLLYVRSWKPSNLASETEASSPLGLTEDIQRPFTA